MDLPGLNNKYGPGLIQGFKVDHSFNSASWQHFGGHTMITSQGLHAMVLIGYRQEMDSQDILFRTGGKRNPFKLMLLTSFLVIQ